MFSKEDLKILVHMLGGDYPERVFAWRNYLLAGPWDGRWKFLKDLEYRGVVRRHIFDGRRFTQPQEPPVPFEDFEGVLYRWYVVDKYKRLLKPLCGGRHGV